MVIKCPHCGHQGRIEASRIPQRGVHVKCPSCKGSFPLRRPEVNQPSAAGHDVASPAPPSSQPAAPVVQESPAAPSSTGQPAGPGATPAQPPVQASFPSEPVLGFKDQSTPPAGQSRQPAGEAGLTFQDPEPRASKSRTAACTGCLKLYNENELAQSGDRKLCRSCLEAFKEKGQTAAENRAAQRMTPSVSAKRKNFVYGGFWIRFGAYLVDGVLLVLVWHFLFSPVFMKIGMSMFPETPLPAAMSLPQDGPMDQARMEALMAQMQDAMNASSGRMITWIWIVQLAGLVVFGSYFIILEGGAGQTVGKKVLGLRVVSPDGDSIGYAKAFARYIGKIISGATLCVGFIMAAFDSEKRALHDHMVNSRVVRE